MKAPLRGALQLVKKPLGWMRSRLPLMRELSPQAAEGEKMF